MSFSIGIIGLPNAGKSTLFQALTKKQVEIAAYVFSTRDPNVGIVAVPDKRLEKIAEIINPKKITSTTIEFVDIAGLVKGAHKGQGLGNQFLSHIRNCDAVLEATRGFNAPKIEHIEGSIEPKRDIDIIKTELLMKDLETLNKIIPKLKKERSPSKKIIKNINLLERIKEQINQGKLISELKLSEQESRAIKEFQFLTAKPVIYILNTNNKYSIPGVEYDLALDLKMELEISELSQSEAKELDLESGLDKLILACYNALNLITFFTITGGKEIRAWTIKQGASALKAAGSVHTDFAEKFIKAETINWKKLIEMKTWAKAREQGKIKIVGKDYIVQDGDVIEFKI